MFESIRGRDQALDQLQAAVTTLEQEVYEASNRVAELTSEAASAWEDDLNNEALALNRGCKPRKAREPEVRAQLEGAQRRLEVLQRRLQLAQSHLSRYISKNAQALYQLVHEAKSAKAHEVSELAAPLAKSLHEYQLPDADAKALKPYVEGPAEENSGEPRDSVVFLGPIHRDNAFDNLIAGQPIGRVQALVNELSTLAARHEQGGDATIVGPTPEESGGAA